MKDHLSFACRKFHLRDLRMYRVPPAVKAGRDMWCWPAADGIIPPYSKVTYDDKSCKKGLNKLFHAPSDLLLLFFSSTKGFSMLIKCRRDIAPQCAHYKRQSRGRIWMILTDSWLNLGPFGPLCILVVHQLPMHTVKPVKCSEM